MDCYRGGFEEVARIKKLDPFYVQSTLEFLGKACAGHPHLRVKIAIDCVAKGYATHEQVAEFVGLSTENWKQYYENFQEGNLDRIPKVLKTLVPARDLRFLAGFTDEQLHGLVRALDSSLQEQLGNLLWRAFSVWEYQVKQAEARR
jgi:hypothetical protein